LPTREALALAQGKEMDLIEVAPNSNPPVCRIMDYGKYKYAQSKKDQEQRKKHKAGELKSLRLSPNIAGHDLEVKAKYVRDFLVAGDKVRLNLRFRSREMSHPEIGRRVLSRIAELTDDVAIVEWAPRIEGRILTMVLAPKTGAGTETSGQEKQPAKA
jgi:translation initiation factor IF-3